MHVKGRTGEPVTPRQQISGSVLTVRSAVTSIEANSSSRVPEYLVAAIIYLEKQ
jgi:hypothetical protein